MKRFILHDTTINVFASLQGAKVVATDTADNAVMFDERDNVPMKAAFYNAITGCNFKAVEI